MNDQEWNQMKKRNRRELLKALFNKDLMVHYEPSGRKTFCTGSQYRKLNTSWFYKPASINDLIEDGKFPILYPEFQSFYS
tara:strand:+ start:128 stop:367 length:240 start_codon:yes stop_codon:yes gene_type:complete